MSCFDLLNHSMSSHYHHIRFGQRGCLKVDLHSSERECLMGIGKLSMFREVKHLKCSLEHIVYHILI